jgi:taurine--2-oxoglutarate transaminase
MIISERPDSIAAIIVESVVGSAGVLITPDEIWQGIRALCDKYKIVMI